MSVDCATCEDTGVKLAEDDLQSPNLPAALTYCECPAGNARRFRLVLGADVGAVMGYPSFAHPCATPPGVERILEEADGR